MTIISLFCKTHPDRNDILSTRDWNTNSFRNIAGNAQNDFQTDNYGIGTAMFLASFMSFIHNSPHYISLIGTYYFLEAKA